LTEAEKVTRRSYVKYVGGIVVVAVVAAAGYGIYQATLPTPTPTVPENWYRPELYPVPDPSMMPPSILVVDHDMLLKDEFFGIWRQLYGRWTEMKVGYNTTDADVVAKLAAGGSGIDVFHQDTVYWWPAVQSDLAEPLDLNKIPNYKYTFDFFKEPTAPQQYQGKTYGVPFIIWKDGLSYNTKEVDVPPEEATLDLLFNPDVNKKYGAKIGMFAGHETVLAAGLYLDMPNVLDMTDEELKKVEKVLMDQRKYVRVYWESSSDLQGLFITGEVNRAWTWETAVTGANKEGGGKVNFVFPLTKSPSGGKGCLGGFEGLGMAKGLDEKHKYASYHFLNYVAGDDYAYQIFKYWNYRPANKLALERMTPEQVKERGLEDPKAFLDSLVLWAFVPRMNKYDELMTKVKAG